MLNAILLAVLTEPVAEAIDKAKQHPIMLAVLAAVPGILAALPPLIDRIGQLARFRETKATLEILKMKYEIEAFCKREQLDFSPISIPTDQIQAAAHTREIRWFQPERLRATFTFRNVTEHPKFGRVVASIAAGLASFYGVGSVIGGIACLFPGMRSELKLGGWDAAGLAVVYVVTGAALLIWGTRIRKAKVLALDGIKAVAGAPH